MSMTIVEQKDISLESTLLNIMAIKENFNTYEKYIDYKRVLPNTSVLLKDYKNYYNLYPEHNTINWELFYTQFSQNWHSNDLESKDIEYYRDWVFPAIQKAEVTDIEKCLIGLIKKQTAEELSKLATNKFDVSNLRKILDTFEEKSSSITKSNDNELTRMSTVDFNILDKADGISWCLPTLQEGLGSLVQGQLVVLSADFGTGKSAAVISQVAHTLQQGREGSILYFNSEGTDADIFARVCSNIYRNEYVDGFEEIVKKRDEVRKRFLKDFGDDKLLVIQLMNSSIDWFQTKLEKYSPSLVIVDITDTLAKEENVLSLKKVFDQLRVLSGQFCPIIATTQAGDQSYQDKDTGQIKERKWLGNKALYGSKTGKGGAADTIITIGKDDTNQNIRYISTPKKKRGKAVNITCELIEEYSLFKELAW